MVSYNLQPQIISTTAAAQVNIPGVNATLLARLHNSHITNYKHPHGIFK